MARRTDEELKSRIEILKKEEIIFTNFLNDIYGDKQC